MANATQKTSEFELNKMNEEMRSQPWYQQWFQSKGLNPNKVKLDGRQRQELAQLAARNGFTIGDRMKVDEAGNFNQMGGYAGMPTAAKIAIGAAPIAGAMLIPGVREATIGQLGSIFGAGGGGGVGAGGTGAGLNAAAAGGASHAAGGGLMMGAGAFPTTASLTAGLPTIGSTALTTGMGSAPSIAGAGSAIAGVGGSSGGGSVINRLLGRGGSGTGGNGQTAADIGSLFERMGNDEANKRLSDFNMNSRLNNDMLQAQQDRRAQETDAMKKIQQAGYIKSGGVPFDASSVKLAGGRELPSFSFPRAPITDEAKQAAGMLEKTMLERLGPNGSFAPKPADEFTDRGTMENIGRFGSYGSSAMGALDNFGLMDDIGRGAKRVGSAIWDLFS